MTSDQRYKPDRVDKIGYFVLGLLVVCIFISVISLLGVVKWLD